MRAILEKTCRLAQQLCDGWPRKRHAVHFSGYATLAPTDVMPDLGRSRRARRAAAICLALALGSAVRAQERGAAEEMQRALTALHHFEYEQAHGAFRRAQDLDRT